MIVSFHEDNTRGVAKTNALIKNKRNRLVPVLQTAMAVLICKMGMYL